MVRPRRGDDRSGSASAVAAVVEIYKLSGSGPSSWRTGREFGLSQIGDVDVVAEFVGGQSDPSRAILSRRIQRPSDGIAIFGQAVVRPDLQQIVDPARGERRAVGGGQDQVASRIDGNSLRSHIGQAEWSVERVVREVQDLNSGARGAA